MAMRDDEHGWSPFREIGAPFQTAQGKEMSVSDGCGDKDDEKRMKLSIIIVNFNGASFLEDCINSIRQHVTVNYEVIVVDNASTDGSISLWSDSRKSNSS
jgi:hypothetical protein